MHHPDLPPVNLGPRAAQRRGRHAALVVVGLAGLVGASLASGCEQLTRIEGSGGPCVPDTVQAAFDRSCARSSCHDAAGTAAGLALTRPASAEILGRDATQRTLPLVTLGDLERSYLAHKIMIDPPAPIGGVRMPVGSDPADPAQAEDIAIILGWIAGADLSGCGGADTDGGTTTGTAVDHGLPCEVDELMERRCRSCHGDPLAGGPMPLVTYDDLLAPAPSDPTRTVAELSSLRMADAAAPMPPPPGDRIGAAELAVFDRWLADGTPEGSCSTTPTPDPFEVEPVCTSDAWWLGDEGDPIMYPGRDCLGCHQTERLEDPDDPDIPDLIVGGTLYPTGHEPNDCFGASGADLRVVVRSIDSGVEIALAPNAAGNFLLHRANAPAGLDAPFSVKVVDGDRERIMPIPAPDGSCNACHTHSGASGAPGRVVVP